MLGIIGDPIICNRLGGSPCLVYRFAVAITSALETPDDRTGCTARNCPKELSVNSTPVPIIWHSDIPLGILNLVIIEIHVPHVNVVGGIFYLNRCSASICRARPAPGSGQDDLA